MEQTKRSTGSGCVKALGIGCLSLLVIVIAIAVMIWTNWDKIKESEWFTTITEMAETAKIEMDSMMELQNSLQLEYPAETITVQARQWSGSNGSSKSLLVNFINPEFEVPDSESEKERKAHEIALKVAGQYPELDRYDFVTVSFVSQRGVGVTFKSTSSHPFPTVKLLEAIIEESNPKKI